MVLGGDRIWLYSSLPKIFLKTKKIEIFNHGNHARDFTYIDDIVNGIYLLIKKKYPKKNKF